MNLIRSYYIFLTFAFLFGTWQNAQARHLVGGDLTYECLGKDVNGANLYEITLTLYRDCLPNAQFPTNTPFDRVAEIGVFDGANRSLVTTLFVNRGDTLIIPLTSDNECVPPPNNLCYASATYTQVVALADNPNGYHLAWGRCCRNESIVNLFNPGALGIAYTTQIPSTDLCNSSPSFNNALPTFICQNDLFNFDHSATDLDGDSLVYELTVPFTAGSQSVPQPTASPPPYPTVNWGGGFGLNNIMNGDPKLNVNPTTGQLIVGPTQTGQYVFSLSVFEYRNGMLLSEVKRDIQINVIECPINFPPRVNRPENNNVSADTLLFIKGNRTCFDYVIRDINGPGVPADLLTVQAEGELLEPPYNATFSAVDGLSPINASICWEPACDFDENRIFTIRISATDNNDCPGPNTTTDTMYVRVITGELLPPELLCASITGPDEIQLNWQNSNDLGVSGFVAYHIFRDDGNGFEEIGTLSDPAETIFIDDMASNADTESYCYRIQTERECPFTELSEPSNVICSAESEDVDICHVSVLPSQQGIEIVWTPPFSVEFGTFRIYRTNPGTEEDIAIADITEPMTFSYVDSSALLPAGAYCYRISAVDACGLEKTTTRDCSVFLTTEQNDFAITLDWTAYEGWEFGVSAYEIWRVNAVNDTVIIAVVDGNTFTYEDLDIVNNLGLYEYLVFARPAANECSPGAWSNLSSEAFEPRFFVPNAFTPNDDGHNDRFEIKGAFTRDYQLQVFNRWGKQIFLSESLDNSWDGTVEGRPVQEGVYVYRLIVGGNQGERFERGGTITLIR